MVNRPLIRAGGDATRGRKRGPSPQAVIPATVRHSQIRRGADRARLASQPRRTRAHSAAIDHRDHSAIDEVCACCRKDASDRCYLHGNTRLIVPAYPASRCRIGHEKCLKTLRWSSLSNVSNLVRGVG